MRESEPSSVHDEPIHLSSDCGEEITHWLEVRESWAIKAAVAANRPLLISGEPGLGKTQLAMAAAKKLERPLVSFTVDSRTESRDLLWNFDAIQRLAEAQILSATCKDRTQLEAMKGEIDERKFVRPGPIWWAIDWNSAKTKLGRGQKPPETPEGWDSECGGVAILIDEIDKADRDLPNGLLEAFGSRQFTPYGHSEPIVRSPRTPPPLMIITTNRERALPSAFLRRCLTLELSLPPVLGPHGSTLSDEETDKFINYLKKRGELHFPTAPKDRLEKAARKILEFRQLAFRHQQPQKPGQSEYLDLLRALHNLEREHDADEIFENVCQFFRKSPEQVS
jgi:MoxR-like ATPase